MMFGVRVLRTAALLVLLAGCANGSRAVASRAVETRAASAPPPTASPGGSASSGGSASPGSCTAASDPRLGSVTLAADQAGLTATWTSTGTDKAASAIWVVTVSGGQPDDYQLTVKATNGTAQSYVFNVDTSAQVDVHRPGGVTVTPAGARESFPWADLAGIGADFTWNAVLDVDGTDVAYCPGDQSFLDFRR